MDMGTRHNCYNETLTKYVVHLVCGTFNVLLGFSLQQCYGITAI